MTTAAAAAPWRRGLHGWQMRSTASGRCSEPADLDDETDAPWQDAAAAGTIAAMLRESGQWSLDDSPRRFDAEDWWLRCDVDFDPACDFAPIALHLGGLAGLADVWVNGRHLLRSENMFLSHTLALDSAWLPGRNRIHLRFESLDAALAVRRPRPRWRAPMIEQQQLRWFRQTVLGRAPGWTPPAAPVGLWREAWLECGAGAPLRDIDLRPELDAHGVGWVEASLRCAVPRASRIELQLTRDGVVHTLALEPAPGDETRWAGRLAVEAPALWWPHTHGEPALYAVHLRLVVEEGAAPIDWPLPALGFRRLALDAANGDFSLSVNGEPVFCRGACWMPLDIVSLRSSAEGCRAALAQARAAGMNMLRVSGATVYEDRAFFEACDAEGVLVWQDFMFANMDYPAEDANFVASVQAEVRQQLARWRAHPSLAVLCGNSEVEQQAAMWGAPRQQWHSPLFHELLRIECANGAPQVPFWPSSTHGGAFPHQADEGTASYYGVGAYLRAPDDARRARLRFATECLGFANVPESSTIARMPQGHALRVHHPGWKARSPRDLGAGWDFDDVRDHYLATLYGVDPLRCRYADHERYLALSRVVSGELMADAFAEWRRPGGGCRGALVWFLRDLWAGAGWGLLDDQGLPKACWWLLRRALQPRALLLTDEGGNGLSVHLLNEPAQASPLHLRVALYGPGDVPVAEVSHAMTLPGRGAATLALASLFDGFFDLSYSYRFGPPAVNLVHVQWLDAQKVTVAEAFHFPTGRSATLSHEPLLQAEAEMRVDGGLMLRLRALRFVQALQIDLEGWALPDNHFHLAPGSTREVVARPVPGAAQATHGWLRPLNAAAPLALRWSA
jgi:beta-mannosidase